MLTSNKLGVTVADKLQESVSRIVVVYCGCFSYSLVLIWQGCSKGK